MKIAVLTHLTQAYEALLESKLGDLDADSFAGLPYHHQEAIAKEARQLTEQYIATLPAGDVVAKEKFWVAGNTLIDCLQAVEVRKLAASKASDEHQDFVSEESSFELEEYLHKTLDPMCTPEVLENFFRLQSLTLMASYTEGSELEDDMSYKLALMFANESDALDYLAACERHNPQSTQVIHDATLFHLPYEPWDLEQWRGLAKQHLTAAKSASMRQNFSRSIPFANRVSALVSDIARAGAPEKVERLMGYVRYALPDTGELTAEEEAVIREVQGGRFDASVRVIYSEELARDYTIEEFTDEKRMMAKKQPHRQEGHRGSAKSAEREAQLQKSIEGFKKIREKLYKKAKQLQAKGKDAYLAEAVKKAASQKRGTLHTRRCQLLARLGVGALEKYSPKDLFELAMVDGYEKGYLHPRVRDTLLPMGVPEPHFDQYCELMESFDDWMPPSSDGLLPRLIIDGASCGADGYFLMKVAPDDPKAAFLGYPTGCCQNIGSQGEDCARHGVSELNSGFYIIIKGKPPESPDFSSKDVSHKDIVACTWAWRNVPNIADIAQQSVSVGDREAIAGALETDAHDDAGGAYFGAFLQEQAEEEPRDPESPEDPSVVVFDSLEVSQLRLSSRVARRLFCSLSAKMIEADESINRVKVGTIYDKEPAIYVEEDEDLQTDLYYSDGRPYLGYSDSESKGVFYDRSLPNLSFAFHNPLLFVHRFDELKPHIPDAELSQIKFLYLQKVTELLPLGKEGEAMLDFLENHYPEGLYAQRPLDGGFWEDASYLFRQTLLEKNHEVLAYLLKENSQPDSRFSFTTEQLRDAVEIAISGHDTESIKMLYSAKEMSPDVFFQACRQTGNTLLEVMAVSAHQSQALTNTLLSSPFFSKDDPRMLKSYVAAVRKAAEVFSPLALNALLMHESCPADILHQQSGPQAYTLPMQCIVRGNYDGSCLKALMHSDKCTAEALSVTNARGATLLTEASRGRIPDQVALVLDAPNLDSGHFMQFDNAGGSALIYAIHDRDEPIISLLLESDKCSLDALTAENQTGDSALSFYRALPDGQSKTTIEAKLAEFLAKQGKTAPETRELLEPPDASGADDRANMSTSPP